MNVAIGIEPAIVRPESAAWLRFQLSSNVDGVDRVIASVLDSKEGELQVAAFYQDISGERAWRSKGRLQGPNLNAVTDVEVTSVDQQLLT